VNGDAEGEKIIEKVEVRSEHIKPPYHPSLSPRSAQK
jgi:hypothetical protein